ncbi:MAG: hypothetical protein P9L99_02270 [Candidatus Lernaella stagnicola]|nr:hypothetical protein [Candidatus Lernaella stagnicola]
MRKLSIIIGVVGVVFGAWLYLQMPSPKLNNLDRPKLALSTGGEVAPAAAGPAAARRKPATPKTRKPAVKQNRRTPQDRRDAARKRREARLKRRSEARKRRLEQNGGAPPAKAARPGAVGRRKPAGAATTDPGAVPDDALDEELAEDMLNELEQLGDDPYPGEIPADGDEVVIE